MEIIIKINKKYIFAFIVLFFIETIIAIYIHDTIIRPYVGDILVVILLYTLIRGFTDKIKYLSMVLFIFATLVEVAQYFNIVNLLNLQSNKVISIMIGTSFDYHDILCYFAGSIIIILWERIIYRKNKL